MIYDFEEHYQRYENQENVHNFKYILFLIAIINSIICLIFERFIAKFVEIFWNKNNIKRYKKEINKVKENNLLGQNEHYEEPIFKYQEVFFYDRRFGNYSKIKNNPNKTINGKKFIELVGVNDNNDFTNN